MTDFFRPDSLQEALGILNAFKEKAVIVNGGSDIVISPVSYTHLDVYKRQGYDLAGILYRADKNSRNCFACKAEHECNWSREKKNTRIKD